MFLLLTNADLLVHSDHKPLLIIFTRHTDNDKCNTWGLEGTALPRSVKVQHIKAITNVLANSTSRLKTVGFYHDLHFKDHHKKLIAPLKPYLLLSL